ncbi:MAG: 30S ribosomal protein S6 [Chloroflexi bacterium]|nr:30S ribosomal protein S6 [Chloroflexota bacterium]
MVSKEATPEATAVADKSLRDYELVLVINPQLEGESLDALINKVSQFITERDGVVSEVVRWGKRKLAYPIKHYMEGSYVLGRIKLKSTTSKELDANLRISEEILRYLLIKVEP